MIELTPNELAELDKLDSHIRVARALLNARLDARLTQKEVAKRAGTWQHKVSALESLGGNPRFSTLDRIARSLGLVVTLVPRDTPVPDMAAAWAALTPPANNGEGAA